MRKPSFPVVVCCVTLAICATIWSTYFLRSVYRRNVVKQMMKFAWGNYVRYAWGANELRPISRNGSAGPAPVGGKSMGLTIVDSLSTLFLMGFTEEFDAATEWVTKHYDIRNAETFSVFEMNIRFLGGLLSAHALSGYGKPEYFARLEPNGGLVPNMEHSACFIGGLYALAVLPTQIQTPVDVPRLLSFAKNFTRTCHLSYSLTSTGLGPESFRMDSADGYPAAIVSGNQQYSLRPEVTESYFYLWKFTGNSMYREWAWEAVQAIQKYCKTPYGYSGVSDVNNEHSAPEDIQQSYFLAKTLKFLYLIFSYDDLLPLSSWVFNAGGHPLPALDSYAFQRAVSSYRSENETSRGIFRWFARALSALF
ncbi:LOW QUALITY PROTEIN: mannosyl-oligosaccharide 1,2-alpha-mannosidase IA-like [Paramacrobiotus metropolitanus]|uniref:LOW QUALITY PROTEIN: mannosyl-oligosaccharide 1,2-alpha-mannosidase IA-like n=1 Tax=Paramacrobiotus metropolitanus TaxID=2943436 RepID=UPI002445A917|nr:LOW QUALITY PROTEIN: mannosyl-oligosaccharide 1,2-alpha-mannosidase IA-like [Paramacrobiotus metropolitanus]